MAAADEARQSGQRAWERLTGWLSARPATGDAAVDALDDIGTVRRLLDHAELMAVRTARRQGKSWSEIATRLGVSRQSAWERWRDVDDETDVPEGAATGSAGVSGIAFGTDPAIEDELIEQAIDKRARGLRRRSTVVVPNVVGKTWEEAREALARTGLLGVNNDADEPPLGWANSVVTDQSPESGAKVPVGSQVVLWLNQGGGSAGVREPRRPKPTPGYGREWRPEPTDEAVG